MERSAASIAERLADTEGGPLQHRVARLTGGADRAVPAGRRSVSVTCVQAAAAGVLLDGEVVPEGESRALTSDYPGANLPAVSISTVTGDIAIVVEVFAGAEPTESFYLLLSTGDRLLLADGTSGILLTGI